MSNKNKAKLTITIPVNKKPRNLLMLSPKMLAGSIVHDSSTRTKRRIARNKLKMQVHKGNFDD